LPAGAAPPYGVPLHLWVLRAPEPGSDFRQVLLLDAGAALSAPAGAAGAPTAEGGRDKVDWSELRRTVLEAWRGFDLAAREGLPVPADRPGVHRAMAAIDLLDDETDLSPARHVPPAAPLGGAAELSHLGGRLAELLAGLPDPATLLPQPCDEPGATPAGVVTIGELVRGGALEVYSSGTGAATRPSGAGAGGTRVVTDQDLATGAAPGAAPDAGRGQAGSGQAGAGPAGEVRTRPGDVLVPALGGGTARVVPAEGPLVGAALGRQLHLLRPDQAVLDPEFLAGHFRSTAGTRRAASHATTTARLDIRRVELPRLPLPAQQRLGAAFARLAAFDTALGQAAALGRSLAQGATDALATGTLAPPAG
ncbi:hypothetical protein BU198_40935, partial [Streptomyces sp. CBMA156]|nr:hypothetical protein [Streptomyces sp. CBMA156]